MGRPGEGRVGRGRGDVPSRGRVDARHPDAFEIPRRRARDAVRTRRRTRRRSDARVDGRRGGARATIGTNTRDWTRRRAREPRERDAGIGARRGEVRGRGGWPSGGGARGGARARADASRGGRRAARRAANRRGVTRVGSNPRGERARRFVLGRGLGEGWDGHRVVVSIVHSAARERRLSTGARREGTRPCPSPREGVGASRGCR